MRRHLISQGFWFAIALLAVSALGGCAAPAAGAATTATMPPPTATATVPGTPSGWSVYRGDHFTIAYPPQWSYTPIPPGQVGNDTLSSVVLNGPQPRAQIQINETTFTQDEFANFCTSAGRTATQLAGLPMRYALIEGVHRSWIFVSAERISYELSTFDGDWPANMQAQQNSILATFRPDDTTSGCPS